MIWVLRELWLVITGYDWLLMYHGDINLGYQAMNGDIYGE